MWIKHIRSDIKYEINSKDKDEVISKQWKPAKDKGKIVEKGFNYMKLLCDVERDMGSMLGSNKFIISTPDVA